MKLLSHLLIYTSTDVVGTYLQIAAKYQLPIESSLLGTSFLKSYKSMDYKYPNFGKDSKLYATSKRWWDQVIRETLLASGCPEKELNYKLHLVQHELFTIFQNHHPYTGYPEIHRVLHNLKHRSIVIGVISNMDERLTPILNALDLSQYTDFILSSYEVGYAKPHIKIYELSYALTKQRLMNNDIDKEDILHVGDDIERDFLGPSRFGVNALLLKREAVSEPLKFNETSQPKIISDLDQIFKHL